MDICFRCNLRATLECECSVLICSGCVNLHLDEADGHNIGLITPFVQSDLQRASLESLSNQLKVLDECSEIIIKISNLLIQEIAILARESLEKLQEKRVELLNDLKMTKKRINDEEIGKLQAISNEILTIQVPSLAPIHEQLQKYFGAPFCKKHPKLQGLNTCQAKKQLIEQYGLFLEGHTSSVC